MRQSSSLAGLCLAAILSFPATAAHVGEADVLHPTSPLLGPDPAWSLRIAEEGGLAHPTVELIQLMLDASPPAVAETLRGRVEDPILLPGALAAARAAQMRARATPPEAALQPRTERLTELQRATLALIGCGVLILGGAGLGFIARAPGGMGGRG